MANKDYHEAYRRQWEDEHGVSFQWHPDSDGLDWSRGRTWFELTKQIGGMMLTGVVIILIFIAWIGFRSGFGFVAW